MPTDRLTADQAVKLFKQQPWLKPTPGLTLKLEEGDDQVHACPMGAYAFCCGVSLEEESFWPVAHEAGRGWDDTVDFLQDLTGFSRPYMDGYTRGFDGYGLEIDPTMDYIWQCQTEYIQGVRDGHHARLRLLK